MSDFQAIGAVSGSLQKLLRDRMQLPLGLTSVPVTISQPPEPENGVTEEARVNMFLYRVTENGFLKNQEIPGDGHPGRYGHPPLSLNLHYLMTAYGTTAELDEGLVNESQAQHLLGSAMRVLHDHAILTESLETVKAPVGQPILDEVLRDQFERVKICLDPLTLEDLSKIWTALALSYRLSAAYTVNVVQIESTRQRHAALLVKTRRLHVASLHRPQISAVYRTPGPGESIGDLRARVSDSLTIEGLNFAASSTWVKLGNADPLLLIPPVLDHTITILIPNDLALQPGAQIVEVQTLIATEVVEGGLDTGALVLDEAVQTSNQALFMLIPTITSLALNADASLLAVDGERLFLPGLKSYVLVDDFAIAVRSSVAPEPWADPTPTSVQVPLPPFPPASTHLVRVRVNGAESSELELVIP